jgi:DNA-binding NarL/FixJ family response regulator
MGGKRLLVVDGDTESNALMRALLGRVSGVVVAVTTGAEALESAKAHAPDLVLLETSLPDIDGYVVCRELRDLCGESLPILLMTSTRNETHEVVAGFLVGGDDYIVKPVDDAELLARVRRHLARSATVTLPRLRPVAPAETFGLTPRELEVLQRLASGCAPPRIARDMTISEKTVASHLQRVLGKMRVHSRLEAVAIAYERGIIGSRPESSADGAYVGGS